MQNSSPLFVLSFSAMLLMLGVGMIVALLPQRVHEMTGSLEHVGLVASVFALAYLLAQLPFGALSDRFGPKRFLVIGYLFCAISGVIFFVSETTGGIFVGRAIQGIGEAPIWALGPAILAIASPSAKGRVIGIYNAVIHVGLTAGPILGLLITPDGQSRLPYLAFAVLCCLAGLSVLIFLRPETTVANKTRPSFGQFLNLLWKRQALVLLTGIFLYGAGYGVFLTVLPVSLKATHGFSATATSLHFVLFYAAISISQASVGIISDRIGRQGFLIWGMALTAVGLALFPFCPDLWTNLPLGVASIGLGTFCVVSVAQLNDIAPNALKGAISGSYYLFWGAGYMIGPWMIGEAGTDFSVISFIVFALLFATEAFVLRAWRGR